MVEIPYGILVREESCLGATYALLDPCPPHPVEVYIKFPPHQDIRTFEGKIVILRGTLHETDCARLLLKASAIGASTEPFTCDEPDAGDESHR